MPPLAVRIGVHTGLVVAGDVAGTQVVERMGMTDLSEQILRTMILRAHNYSEVEMRAADARGALLGGAVVEVGEDYVELAKLAEDAPNLLFIKVPEAKSSKNRLHLDLVVPDPPERCWIEVGGQRYSWREGQAVVFDDLYPHEVHNDTGGVRAVLFVDFERPCRAPVKWLNRLVLMAAPFTDEIRRGKANHDAWEKGYYRQK